AMRDFFESLGGDQGIVNAFLSAELAIVGSIGASSGIQAAGPVRPEETAGRAEVVLATATSRLRWANGLFGVALGGVALLMLLVGLGLGVGHALHVEDSAMI